MPGESGVLDGFVAAVNEVVAAAFDDQSDASVEVRWLRRLQPHTELYAEIRNTAGTPKSIVGDDLVARLLDQFAERLQIDERIGGSVITIRCRA